MSLFVKHVKKTSEPQDSGNARPKGLFIDTPADTRGRDNASDVIDVAVRDVEEPLTVEPVNETPSKFGGIRITKPVKIEPTPEIKKPSLRDKFSRALPVRKEPQLADVAQAEPSKNSEALAKATEEKVKPKVKAKANSTPQRETSVKLVHILAELDTGRNLYWSLSEGQLTQLTDKPTGPIFSFSKEDFRFKTDATLNHKQATDLALQEVGEAVQVVNKSKDLTVVYATRQERALGADKHLIPAQQVLDTLLLKKGVEGTSIIYGVLLKDAESDQSLAVLYHIGPDGEASKPQISVNPDSMEFVISQFSASRKIDKANTKVVLFENNEFLSVAASAQAYPHEPVWRGIAVRKLVWGTAFVTLVTALGTMGWAGFEFQRMSSLKAKQHSLKVSVTQTQKMVGERLKASLPDFVDSVTLNPRLLADRAQQIWIPGSRVVLTADLTAAKYEMWLRITNGQTFYNRPSSIEPVGIAAHQSLIKFMAPEGCTRDEVGVAGSMNETELTIHCPTGNPALARYRND